MQQASQSAKNICISTHSVNIISYFKLYSYFIGKIFAKIFANKKITARIIFNHSGDQCFY